MDELIFKEETYKIIGCAMDVYNELGFGFLEGVYQEALAIELKIKKLYYKNQVMLEIYYKGHKLEKEYKPDFIVDDKIVIELKAEDKINNSDIAQIINYLKATKLKLGLIINFGNKEKLEWKRVVLENK